jgi:hypothetical protein
MNDYKQRLAHYNDTECHHFATGGYVKNLWQPYEAPAATAPEYRIQLLSYYLPLIALVAAACELVGLSLWLSGPVVVWLLAEAVNNVEDTIDAN